MSSLDIINFNLVQNFYTDREQIISASLFEIIKIWFQGLIKIFWV